MPGYGQWEDVTRHSSSVRLESCKVHPWSYRLSSQSLDGSPDPAFLRQGLKIISLQIIEKARL